MSQESPKTSHFGEADRARLWYKVLDLLPIANDRFANLNGQGLCYLENLLQRGLGRLHLSFGFSCEARVKAFITEASEVELIELVNHVPIARMLAHQEYCERYSTFLGERGNNPKQVTDEACSELNLFLESTASAARFNKEGVLQLDVFAPDLPVTLAKLPGKEQLRSDLEAKCSEEAPTSLIFVDLDHFKQVNDTLGHQAGDECLVKAVEILGTVAAMRGRVYRYGGDEFAIVLPNCTTSEAAPIAERIRREVELANVGGTVR